MREHDRVYRRLLRRETHASRTAPAVIVAIVVAVLALGAVVVGVLTLVDPAAGERISTIATDTASNTTIAATTGAVLLALGAFTVLLAVLPGRRTRHALTTERAGVVIESAGLAESVASTVARTCGLQRRQIRASVHRRRLVTVSVRPVSGVPVDREAIEQAARSTTVVLGLRLQPRVIVQEAGTIA